MNSYPSLLILLLALGLVTGCGSDSSDSQDPDPTPTNSAPAITDPGALTVTEGTAEVANISTSDSDGDSVTLTVSGGADEALFSIEDGALTFLAAPDFESPSDADANNVYVVQISASDGTDTTTLDLEVTVKDAFEGRVVDGPVAGAAVYVDLNCNVEQDEGEPAGETDTSGFFKIGKVEAAEGCNPKIIAKGGTDTATGKSLENLVLVADLPTDETKAVAVSPLTTIVAAAETAEEKAQVLQALGLGDSSLEDILTTDTWAGAEAEDASAVVIQRINSQLATVLQAAAEAANNADSETNDAAKNVSAAAASIVSAAKAAVASGGVGGASTRIDLTDAALVGNAITAAAAVSGRVVAAETIAAVARSVAVLNVALSDESLNPTAAIAIALATRAQETVLVQVVAVVAGTVAIAEFEAATDAKEVFKDIDAGVDAIDTDKDGLADSIDPDDDNDGVLDNKDAFRLIALGGRTDTDGDGRPNECDAACLALGMVADTDDDNDGVLDTKDAFPLISLGGRTDTDGDGYPDDCDSSCQTTGMIADADDDNDGVLDSKDAFPLISLGGRTDTDGDGRPDDCDTTCKAAGLSADDDDDNDTLKDSDEILRGTNPLLADTDGDNINDAVDPFPTFAGSAGFSLPSTITVLATEE